MGGGKGQWGRGGRRIEGGGGEKKLKGREEGRVRRGGGNENRRGKEEMVRREECRLERGVK